MLKKFFALMISGIILLTFAPKSNAMALTPTVSPCYLYTSSATCVLRISNGSADCESTAKGNNDTTKIEITQYLEKKNGKDWETVSGGKWSNSTNNSTLTVTGSISNIGCGTYRVRAVFTVYGGSKYETFEKTSSEKNVS